MIRGFYSGRSGLLAQQTNLNTVANNFANSNTSGFKAQRADFTSLLYANVNGALPQISTGHGTKVNQITTDFTQGTFNSTGRELDFALNCDGFFAVENGESGDIFYTRAGNFQWQVEGDTKYLITPNGEYVLSNEEDRIEVESNEKIDASVLGVFSIPNPYGLTRVGSNRYALTEAAGEPEIIEEPDVKQNYLEVSGVDVTKEMVKMIEASKAFSFNSRVVTVADEIEQITNQLSS